MLGIAFFILFVGLHYTNWIFSDQWSHKKDMDSICHNFYVVYRRLIKFWHNFFFFLVILMTPKLNNFTVVSGKIGGQRNPTNKKVSPNIFKKKKFFCAHFYTCKAERAICDHPLVSPFIVATDGCYYRGLGSMVPTFRTDKFPWLCKVFSYFFPHFSSIFSSLCSVKVWHHISMVFMFDCQISSTFPVFIPLFQCQNFQIFPVFWVKFPSFSSLIKTPRLFPDRQIVSQFASPSGNHGFPVLLKYVLSDQN